MKSSFDETKERKILRVYVRIDYFMDNENSFVSFADGVLLLNILIKEAELLRHIVIR